MNWILLNHKSYRDTRKIIEIISSIVISRTHQRDKSQQSNGYSWNIEITVIEIDIDVTLFMSFSLIYCTDLECSLLDTCIFGGKQPSILVHEISAKNKKKYRILQLIIGKAGVPFTKGRK